MSSSVNANGNRKRLIFHGSLREIFPEGLEVICSTVEEAIRFLNLSCPKLKELRFEDRPVVQVVDFDCEQSLKQPTDVTELHFLPAFCGSGGDNPFVQIIVGSILIAVGVLITPFAPMVGSALISMGASLVLGGLLQLIMPAPSRDLRKDDPSPDASRYLGAQGNTVAAGTRIPLIYGKFKAYGHYISFDIDAKDVITDGT